MVSISITDRYRFKRNNNPEERTGREREGRGGEEGLGDEKKKYGENK